MVSDTELAIASATFVVTHFGMSSTPLRARLAGGLGERVYRVLVSLVLVAWMVEAYAGLPHDRFLWLPGSGLLFGALALVAGVGTVRIDFKRSRANPGGWYRFAAATSNLPFAALIAGRAGSPWREIGWWRPLAGLAVFAVLALLHPDFAGVAPW